MAVCSLCPGRFFKDDIALQQHTESKHFTCEKCGKVLYSQQALDQHDADKHYAFECRYCDRGFSTDNGRLAHEVAKHPPTFECEYCDREFTTDEGRLAHQKAKHTLECEYCDREFTTDEGRLAHQKAKHTFECHYCDREFNFEEARQQHEDAKHPSTFECEHCDREFTTDEGRLAHQKAKHTFECHHCDREFDSEDARRQHEDTVHCRSITCSHYGRSFASADALSQHELAFHSLFECRLCNKHFTRIEALREHEKTMPHVGCGHCTSKFFTQGAKNGHEQSCACNPANHVKRPTSAISARPPVQFGTLPSVGPAVSAVSRYTNSESVSPTSPSPLSDSTSSEGEMFHSTSGISSVDAAGEGATVEQPCTCSICKRTLSPSSQMDTPCVCSICRRILSPSSHTDVSVQNNAGDLVSPDDEHLDDSTSRHDLVFQCTPCLMLFETAEAFRDHVCASRTTMLRSHCPICYSQFDDGPSLQKHLEGVEFTCQFCLIRCCSEEMLQDHLLSHPTCGKCGKSFVDNLALCAHVESDHPVVVCWDCDGVVVEKNDLELHYADSPAHPSCTFCGVGKKNLIDMDEHVKHDHVSSAVIEANVEGGKASSGADSAENRPSGEYREDPTPRVWGEIGRAQPSSIMEATPFGGPGDEAHDNSSQVDSTLPLSPQSPASFHVEHVNESVTNPSIVDICQSASPSPTPSEHGSNATRQQLHASEGTNGVMNSDAQPPSLASSVSSESLSDTSTRHSPMSESSNSIVFVSADGIPDYIRENRAILIITSAGSGSSGGTPLRLPSSSSLESLDVVVPRPRHEERADATKVAATVLRLHCRICLRDPCEDMTATICGHLFCKRCITQAVVAKSECPVCQSATLLYCLFKLDLSV